MEKKFRRVVEPWIERINRVFVVFAGLLIVIMGFLSTYGAIRRYAFNSPEPVSYEFGCIFLLVSFVLANAAVKGRTGCSDAICCWIAFPRGSEHYFQHRQSDHGHHLLRHYHLDQLRRRPTCAGNRPGEPVGVAGPSVSGEAVHSYRLRVFLRESSCTVWFLGCLVQETPKKRRGGDVDK